MSDTTKAPPPASISRDHPVIQELLNNPDVRKSLGLFCQEDIAQFEYFAENPWIDLRTIVDVADRIMDIAPETSRQELLNILCRETAMLTKAKGATCRTYDPSKSYMLASGSYNWNVERTAELPHEDTVAGEVIKSKRHYCVSCIETEPLYKEKQKALAAGVHSMLALPILVTDYEGAQKKNILIGTLQLYFSERNKVFYPEQIKLLKSIVNRISYVLAQKSKLELQRRADIIKQSRRALIAILKKMRSFDQVLSFIVAKIAELINVNRCSLFVVESSSNGNRLAVLVAGYPLVANAHTYGITLSFDQHPAFKEVYDTGQPLLIENARQDPRVRANYELYLNKRIKNVYFVPIKDENDIVTHVLVLDGDESRPLEKDELSFCNALIQDIELCIQTSLHSQQRHDFLNQVISFGAIARLYTKKHASPDATAAELNILFKKLHRSMLAINDIITDRLPFAQLETFNLNEIVAERFDAYYFPPQVAIKENIFKGEILIHADPKKVGRIIGNLLDNAHKKLVELKSGVLELYTYVDGPYAVAHIGNTGAIPEEVRALLNEQKPVVRPDKEGGMGLSIVKLFTMMHNGIFEYESSPEKHWTFFRIKLPLTAC